MTDPVTEADFRGAMDRLGVGEGGRLIVHSSLSSFGRFEGGAAALAGALVRHVGPGGLVMMPAFTYGSQPFHRHSTPAADGAVAEAFRTLPGVLRSEHPTHSVTAAGRAAEEAVAGHDPAWPCGVGGPLHRAAGAGGRVLLIGVTHTANSLLHVAQCLARVPYLDRFRDAPVRRDDGSVQTLRVRRAGCSRGFDRQGERLDAAALTGRARCGDARLLLYDGAALLTAAAAVFLEDPLALLCPDPGCFSCNEAREMAEAAG